MNENDVIKLIKSKQEAIDMDLLLAKDLQEFILTLERFLDANLQGDDILSLEYKKFKLTEAKRYRAAWSTSSGYPAEKSSQQVHPWVEFFEKFIAKKTLVGRLEDQNLWVESRTQNGNQHLLVGEKDNKGEKVHIVIDSGTGEIRIEKKDQDPSEIFEQIEATLTLKDGRRVKTLMEFGETLVL
jgi:hypothetical protein